MQVTVYDGLSPWLRASAATLARPVGLMGVVATALREVHRAYWYGRGPFWQTKIARYLNRGEISDVTASIVVGGEGGAILLHKIDGGTVRPVPPKKYLAIPANDAARALGWPSHWSSRGDGQLDVVFGRGRVPVALALRTIHRPSLRRRVGLSGGKGNRAQAQMATRKGQIMYWLKRSATHKPDPAALPPEADVVDAVRAAGQVYLDAVARGDTAANRIAD